MSLAELALAESDDEYAWEGTRVEAPMGEFELSLRCPICADWLGSNTGTGSQGILSFSTCEHSFCSMCIRKAMKERQSCPSCNKKCSTTDFVHNATLTNVVTAYRNARGPLLEAVQEKYAATKAVPVASVRAKSCSALMLESTMAATTVDLSADDSGGSSKPATYKGEPVYNMLKEDKLRRMLEDLGLNTRGRKDALKQRHAEFVLAYNSLLDDPGLRARRISDAELTKLACAQVKQQYQQNQNEMHGMSSGRRPARSDPFARAASAATAAASAAAKEASFKKLALDLRRRTADRPANGISARATDAAVAMRSKTVAGAPVNEMKCLVPGSPWRVVWSMKRHRPFYFNTATSIGTFVLPSELAELAESHSSAPSSSACKSGDIGGCTPYAVAMQASVTRGENTRLQSSTSTPPRPSSSSSPNSDNARAAPLPAVSPEPLATNDESAKNATGAPAATSANTRVSAGVVIGSLSTQHSADTSSQNSGDGDQAQPADWACPRCTYQNEGSRRTCEMCDAKNPNPRPKKRRRRATGGRGNKRAKG